MSENTRTSPNLHQLLTTLSQQLNVTFVAVQFNHYYFLQGHQEAVVFPQALYAFAVTALLSFLQLKYQGKKDETPFEKHPTLLRVVITSLLLYCLGCCTEFRFSSKQCYRKCARKVVLCCMIVAASLSVAITASILLPDSVGSVVSVIYFVLSAGEVLYCICCKVIGIWRLVARRFTSQRPLLPLRSQTEN